MAAYPEMPHVEGVTHHDVIANGVRLHVAEGGNGEPLLMVHGWPQHWWEWRHLIPPLAEGHRVICPDLRGFGWSEVPEGGFEPEVFAADLLGLLDALELERVRLVGHDWGALASFILCLRHPGRVSRYLALNMIHPWIRARPRQVVNGGSRLWYQAALAVPLVGPAAMSRGAAYIGRRMVATSGDPSRWDDGAAEVFTRQLREPDRARAFSKLYRWSIAGGLMRIALGRYRGMRLQTPTLLLFGTGDFAIHPIALEGWDAHADDMRVELIPGVGHFIADERPDLVLDRARAFFGME